MIQLRPEHIAAFEAQTASLLSTRIIYHIRSEHARIVEHLSDQRLREMVDIGISRAHRYGFASEHTLTTFVWLMFRVAPNFDEQPEIHQVLCDVRLKPEERIDKLVQIDEHCWTQAMIGYDATAWFPVEGEPADPANTSFIR